MLLLICGYPCPYSKMLFVSVSALFLKTSFEIWIPIRICPDPKFRYPNHYFLQMRISTFTSICSPTQ